MTLNVNGTFHVVEVHQVIYSMVIGWGFMVFGILLNLLYYMVHDSFYLVCNHIQSFKDTPCRSWSQNFTEMGNFHFWKKIWRTEQIIWYDYCIKLAIKIQWKIILLLREGTLTRKFFDTVQIRSTFMFIFDVPSHLHECW